ncbi:MAG: CDP-glycerol glycerophosphotransferase family protein, partial [Clostridia bacterium]|nr:CDP-glycerol glycerophosphotransferase family protein [Clostridia bacterium]
LYKVVPQAKGKKVILYAPTFRGRVASARTPNQLNLGMFEDHFGDDYVLLFKHHPFVKKIPVISDEFAQFAFDVTQTLDIEDLLCTADICITDYSSLVFEYSLFEKPIIFYAYDLENYCDWRGFYYDYYEISPGPVFSTNKEMIYYIENLDTRFDKVKIKDFRKKFMRSCDGNSTDRILRYIFDKDKSEQKI